MFKLGADQKRKDFDGYLESYYSRVYNYLLRLVYDPILGEDITQEAFLRAWQHYASYDQSKSFFPWIVTIARNLAVDRLRKQKESLRDPNEIEKLSLLPDSLTSMEQVEEALQLEKALARLSEKQRSVVYLYYYTNLSLEEVAGIIRKSRRATISFLHRTRQKLKEHLLESKSTTYSEK